MANKITKKETFTALRALAETSNLTLETSKGAISNEALLEFLDHEIELLERKNKGKDGEKKPTTKQTENETVKGEILNYMELGTSYTVSDLLENVPNQPEDMSHHRMVALLSQLVDDEAITRSKVKGVTYFTLTD